MAQRQPDAPFPRRDAPLPVATPPSEDAPEYAVYVVLKLDACERRLRGAPGRPPITARWLQSFLQRLARLRDGPLELQDTTSHFVRERLRDLNHGTALQAVDTGGPLRYNWTEVLGEATMRSYREMRTLLQGRPFLGLDVARLESVFQGDAFTTEGFLEVFRTLHEASVRRRWYSLASRLDTAGAAHTALLLRRLGDLRALGLVEGSAMSLRLTRRAHAATHWFHLVVHSVDYPVPR